MREIEYVVEEESLGLIETAIGIIERNKNQTSQKQGLEKDWKNRRAKWVL